MITISIQLTIIVFSCDESCDENRMEEFDLLIRNTTVVDQSGKSAYGGSIGVKGDKVSYVGDAKRDAK